MPTVVRRHLGWLPALPFEEVPVLQPVDLNMERTAALDHFSFVVASETPCREVAAGAGTYSRG